jgi:hypothetical protein
MHEVIVDFITTVDGYASGEGWPGWWGSRVRSTSAGSMNSRNVTPTASERIMNTEVTDE